MREFKLRLPRLDEVKGENRLSVIKTRGAKANPTEFANRMGCKWDYYIKDNIKEGKRGKKVYYRTKELICGNYYLEKQDIDEKILKSIGSGSERWEKEEFDEQIADKKKVISIGRSFLNQSIADDELSIIDGYGRKTYRDIGVRLVMQMDEKDFIPTNEEHLQRAEDGVLEVELGYLPKRIVKDGKEYDKLKKADKDKLDETFVDLAKEYSDDGTYNTGGLIENFMSSTVVSEFWDASNKLKDGEYTKTPVKTTYGYHIILRKSKSDKPSLEDSKDEIKEAIVAKKMENQEDRLNAMNELRKDYKLSIKDSDMEKSYNDYLDSLKESTKKSSSN